MSGPSATQVLVVLVLTGCAAANSARSPLLTANWQPPMGQTCSLARGPLPALAELTDSAKLAMKLEKLSGFDRGSHAVFSVSSDSTGVIDEVHYVEGNTAGSVSSGIADIILDAARNQPRDSSTTALIRFDVGDSLRIRTSRSEACRPIVTNREVFSQVLTSRLGELSRTTSLVPGKTYTSIVQVFVDSDGTVKQIRLKESAGREEIDRLAIGLAPILNFRPALLNRQPVGVWVQMPISARIPLGSTRPNGRGPGM